MKLQSSFNDMPIRSKLRGIILSISWFAVLGSCTSFLVYQWFAARSDLRRTLELAAAVMADQCAAAVEFSQNSQAEIILQSLKVDHQIVYAAVYSQDGRLFATYLREGVQLNAIPSQPGYQGLSSSQGDLVFLQPIRSGTETIGTLGLRSDMSEAWQRLRISFLTVGFVLLGVGSAVFLLSKRMGRLISDPIQRLANAVQSVSATRDYSIRVRSESRDELGSLIDGFNDMLCQIQHRDSALALARTELEQRVVDRTRELEEEIAERRAAEMLLRENDCRLKEAQEIAKLGSWEWDLSTQRVTWSDEVYRIYGRSEGDFGGSFEEFIGTAHVGDRHALEDSLALACKGREPFLLDYRIVLPEGSTRYLHGQGKILLGISSEPLKLICTLQDVTERRLADQEIHSLNRALEGHVADLAAVNKDLEAFSYSVSHDLRAPLRAIGGYSKMFMDDFSETLTAGGRRYLDVIVESTLRMGRLIDDLLSFSQLGRRPIKASTIDLEMLTREIIAELQDSNQDRQLDVRVTSLPQAVGDSAMVRQVLMNLLANAVKYTRGRERAVIEIGATTMGEETIYSVKDNGVGFDMLYARKLFGVFQRLHSSEEFEGTGVGLALVQRIVQRHGGRVWGEGKVDGGATFYFTLSTRTEGESDSSEAGTPPSLETVSTCEETR